MLQFFNRGWPTGVKTVWGFRSPLSIFRKEAAEKVAICGFLAHHG